MNAFHMYVAVPLAGFRVAQAREFWETYPCPPPSTVYGMLLSVVGESNRLIHKGAEIAFALVSEPQRSTVLRTLWRTKDASEGPGLGSNKRPDFQELLTDIRLSVWVRQGSAERRSPPLVTRVRSAIGDPRALTRFGGLSLGESTHLVNEVRLWRDDDQPTGRILLPDAEGNLSMPIWPDHVGSRGTVWGQFKLQEMGVGVSEPPEAAWISISFS